MMLRRRMAWAGMMLLACSWTPAQEPELPEGRLLFLVGLGDLDPHAIESTFLDCVDPSGAPRTYQFNRSRAEQQRKRAISTELEADPAGYRDGTPYQLRDDAGQALPIYWVPWRTRAAVERLSRTGVDITEDDVEAARSAAREGRDYEPEHIAGAWVYADPEFWSGEAAGFTEKDLASCRASVDQWGARVVICTVKPLSRDGFEDYTSKYVSCPLCVVWDHEAMTAPIVQAALYDSVMITGGGMGFTKEELDDIVGPLNRSGIPPTADIPEERSRPRIGLIVALLALVVAIVGFKILRARREPPAW